MEWNGTCFFRTEGGTYFVLVSTVGFGFEKGVGSVSLVHNVRGGSRVFTEHCSSRTRDHGTFGYLQILHKEQMAYVLLSERR
jgi:hypothetical protein